MSRTLRACETFACDTVLLLDTSALVLPTMTKMLEKSLEGFVTQHLGSLPLPRLPCREDRQETHIIPDTCPVPPWVGMSLVELRTR